MFKAAAIFLMLIAASLFAQATELPHQYKTAETVGLHYPVNTMDVRAIGMGNAQIADGTAFNAMLYNPALLGHKRNSFEFLGFQTNMSSQTFDAVNYLSHHLDEFEQATSLNQIWEALGQLTRTGASSEQKLNALQEIQDGLVFIDDLFGKVTGPSDNPQVHGMSIVPGIKAQLGNFGFSLYGFGQAGFVFQLSPTFESLLNVHIPATLENPVEAARSAIQLTAALAPALIGPKKFSDQVFPAAFYLSYFDIVAAAGYGFPVNANLTVGANLKIINRRFLLDRISVDDYDEIISQTWEKFQSDVTGVTGDIGLHYQFNFGSSIGATFQNIIPVQEITKSFDTEFKLNKILKYDISQDGQIDSLQYVSWETTLTRPFELTVPFLMSFGICHPIADNWNIALDWVDILENDTRYEKTADRIRIGTAYKFDLFDKKLGITPRIGMSDQHLSFGLGLTALQFIRLDGAYAYNNFLNENTFFAQLVFGW